MLALDLSKSRTGWAVWQDGWDMPRYGNWKLGGEYTPNGGVFAKLQQQMHELRAVMPYERIHYEQPINPASLQGFTNIQSIRLAIGLAAHTESYGAAMGCRTNEVHIDTWRIDFVGGGEIAKIKADARALSRAQGKRVSARDDLKFATMERCRQLGMKPAYDDEADAIGILTYSLLTLAVTPPWIANEVLRAPLELRS
jgi:hypothetical protein